MAIGSDFYVDPLGQHSLLRFRCAIHHFYEINTATADAKTKATAPIEAGYAKLVAAFPWLAGAVVPDQNGQTKIIPSTHQSFIIKDFTDDPTHPAFALLKAKRFPMKMIGDNIYSTYRPTRGHPDDEDTKDEPVPAWLLQINIVRGGLVLVSSLHHNVMDATGNASVLEMLSRCCEGGGITPQELHIGNRERRSIIDVSDFPLPPDFALPTFKSAIPDYTTTPAPTTRWEYFRISAAHAKNLKAKANATKPADVPFVSTDDAITALFWQRILATRDYSSEAEPPKSQLYRCIDGRPHLGVEANHPGIILSLAHSQTEVATIVSEPLGTAAARLRKDLDPKKPMGLMDMAKLFVKMLGRPDEPQLGSIVKHDSTYDFMNSSWIKQNNFEVTCGLGKKPIAVRVGETPPMQGWSFFMPADAHGDIDIAFCVTTDELGKLLDDKEFTDFVELI